MSRTFLPLISGIVLVAAAIGDGHLRAQAPGSGAAAPAGDGKEAWESLSLDGNVQVPITIRGHYVRKEPAGPSPELIHQVRARGTILELDTSLYENLRRYLDDGKTQGYLKSGKTAIFVRGILANAPARDASAEGSSRWVCKVQEFRIVPEGQATAGSGAQKIQGQATTARKAAQAGQFLLKNGGAPAKPGAQPGTTQGATPRPEVSIPANERPFTIDRGRRPG